MKKQQRKKNEPQVETQVLVECRRRCCLCVFLEGNTNVRNGQIAHIDGNRANNRKQNLVWLCLEHHNQYDSRTSQSKNITVYEVKHYRDNLLGVVQKQDLQITFPSTNGSSSGNRVEYNSSGYLVGSIFEAYDRELANLEKHNRPNGIKLKNLAKTAAAEEGDFFAARQAFMALLRLGGECEITGGQRTGISDPVQTASVISAAEDVLLCFASTDFSLFLGAIHEAREMAIKGDSLFADFDPSTTGPSPIFYPLGQVLCRLGRRLIDPKDQTYSKLIGEALKDLALSASMLLHVQGLTMPSPPGVIWISAGGERVVPEGEDKRLEPFIWIASRIAYLSEPAYQAALQGFKFILATGNVLVNKEKGYSADTTISFLKRWMVFPGHALICLSVKLKKDIEPVEDYIKEIKQVGVCVTSAAQAFVVKERELVLRPRTA